MGGMVRGPLALTAVVTAIAAAGCGAADPPPLAASCTGDPRVLLRALERAPAAVRMPDGATLSSCIRGARGDGEIQGVGVVLTEVSDELARRVPAHPGAAAALGYLVGAVGEAASHTAGIHAELARRIEQSATAAHLSGAQERSFERGRRAGARLG